jgi:hypothetical protein
MKHLDLLHAEVKRTLKGHDDTDECLVRHGDTLSLAIAQLRAKNGNKRGYALDWDAKAEARQEGEGDTAKQQRWRMRRFMTSRVDFSRKQVVTAERKCSA